MSTIDLSPILTPILQVVGIGLAGLAAALIQRALARVNISITDAQRQQLEDAAAKSLQAGIGLMTDRIRAKGWDHPEVQNGAVAAAANYAIAKFPAALAAVGIDVSNPQQARAQLDGILNRKFPEEATKAAASPVTPPAPAMPAPSVAGALTANTVATRENTAATEAATNASTPSA